MSFIKNIDQEVYRNYFLKLLATVFIVLLAQSAVAQYIHAIHDYKPAPGQFINTAGGILESAEGIIGSEGGLVSLGAYGGYIVFSFEQSVENHSDNPYGVDFVIFGNATAEFSEAGIVSVMKDENANNLPDDTWYELAGSDYFFTSSHKSYSINYTDPHSDIASDIFWEDNSSETGFVYANSFHLQSYYPNQNFDPSFYSENCTFNGTEINAVTDFSDAFRVKSYPRKFGYADNNFSTGIETDLPDNPYSPENEGMGGDAMDISWAIDSYGNYVELDQIHFVKIYTALNGNVGSLGELSTEIRSAVDISPSSNTHGSDSMLVIEDFPSTIISGEYPLKAHFYKSGRKVTNQNILWSVIKGDASINTKGVLFANQVGELDILAKTGDLEAIIHTVVGNDLSANLMDNFAASVKVYPNPFINEIYISGKGMMDFELMGIDGKMYFETKNSNGDFLVYTNELPSGIYFLKLSNEKGFKVYKLIKI